MAKKDKSAIKDKELSSSEIVRKFKQNPALFIGTVVVLVLVIVSFVLVPALVPNSTKGEGDYTFGYYDKTPIAYIPGNRFSQFRDQAISNLQAQGIDLNDIQAVYTVWRQAYDATVVHTAVLQMMKKSNYAPPEKTVDREVALLPQFQENGRFSRALYNRVSDSDRLALWKQVNDDLTKGMFFTDYLGLLIPSTEIEFIANMSSVKREFEMVYFNVDDYPDSEYLAYAREHSSLFDTVHMSLISVGSNEREVRKILDSIKDGTISFEEAARTQSVVYADRGGDMGSRCVYEFDGYIADEDARRTVLALGRGELSDLVRIGEYWSIFRVEEELKKADFDDEAVMDKVRSYVNENESGLMYDWAEKQANEFIADAKDSSFYNAAYLRNMESFRFGPLSINFGNIDIFPVLSIPGYDEQAVENISNNENFWKTAFSTTPQTPSEPLVQGKHVLVLLPVDETKEEYEESNDWYTYSWIYNIADQYMHYYFLYSDKMEDNFWDVFFRLYYQ